MSKLGQISNQNAWKHGLQSKCWIRIHGKLVKDTKNDFIKMIKIIMNPSIFDRNSLKVSWGLF